MPRCKCVLPFTLFLLCHVLSIFAGTQTLAGKSTLLLTGEKVRWKVQEEPVGSFSCGTTLVGPRCAEALEIALSGRWLVSGGEGGLACAWPLDNLAATSPATCAQLAAPIVSVLAVLHNGGADVMVIAAGQELQLWQLPDNPLAPSPLALPVDVRSKAEQESPITSVALSPDGQLLLSGDSAGNLYLWDVDGQSLHITQRRSFTRDGAGHVSATLVMHDNDYFASGHASGFVLIWDLHDEAENPQPLKRFYHGGKVLSIVADPSGHIIFAGGSNGKISFWDVSLDQMIPFMLHGYPISKLQLSQDGEWLFSAGDNGVIKLWDVADGSPSFAGMWTHEGMMAGFVLSPDGKYIVSGDGGSRTTYRIFVRDVRLRAAANPVSFLHEQSIDNVTSIVFFPNGTRLASAHSQGSVCIWDLASRSAIPVLRLEFSATIETVAVLPCGKRLLVQGVMHAGGESGASPSKTVLLVNLHTQKVAATFSLQDTPPHRCDLKPLPNGSGFFACRRTSVDFWDLSHAEDNNASSTPKARFESPGVVQTLEVTPDGAWLIIGSTNGVSMQRLDGLGPDQEVTFTKCGSVLALAVNQSSTRLVGSAAGGMLCMWNIRTFDPEPILVAYTPTGDVALSVDFATNSLDELILIGGERNGLVSMWDVEGELFEDKPQPYMSIDLSAYNMCVQASPDGTMIFTGTSDGQVKGWFVYSMDEYAQLLLRRPECQETSSSCSLSAFRIPQRTAAELQIPLWLDATALRLLDLSGSRVARMSPTPPWSLVSLNLSGARVGDWADMKMAWYIRPRVIDVTKTTNPILPSVTGLRPVRRTARFDCASSQVCLIRAQHVGLCAHAFQTHGFYQGRSVAGKATIFVDWDVDPFKAWLCDCPAGTFGRDGSSCMRCPPNTFCPSAGLGREALNERAIACPHGSGTLETGSSSIDECACNPGFFSDSGHINHSVPRSSCRQCDLGSYSEFPGSTQCQPCRLGLASDMGSTCAMNWPLVTIVAILAVNNLAIAWGLARQYVGILIDDVRCEDDSIIVTSCGRHWISEIHWPRSIPVKIFGTGHPKLDGKHFRARCLLGGYRFELLDSNARRIPHRIDASSGHIRPWIPFLILFSGRPLPLCVCWPCAAAVVVLIVQRVHLKRWYVGWSLALSTAAALLFRLCGITFSRTAPVHRRCSEFRAKVLQRCSDPRPCPRGACRAVTAQQLSELYEFFKSFISDRDMYYMNSSILLPITKPEQLSFAEFVGPSETTWFVSHYWGTPFQHFVASVVRHAQLCGGANSTAPSSDARSCGPWRQETYWICSLSNNQWNVKEELGSGDWAQSSFYKALTSAGCKATVMVIEEEALPLTRAWCLFEVLQTFIKLGQKRGQFSGLLLATPSGVLNYPGSASVDAAMAVAEKLAQIRMQDAEASDQKDKRMIQDLVLSYEGGFETMNKFIRDNIREALMVIKGHHNEQFERLMELLLRREADSCKSSCGGASSMHGTIAPPLRDSLLIDSGSSGESEDESEPSSPDGSCCSTSQIGKGERLEPELESVRSVVEDDVCRRRVKSRSRRTSASRLPSFEDMRSWSRSALDRFGRQVFAPD